MATALSNGVTPVQNRQWHCERGAVVTCLVTWMSEREKEKDKTPLRYSTIDGARVSQLSDKSRELEWTRHEANGTKEDENKEDENSVKTEGKDWKNKAIASHAPSCLIFASCHKGLKSLERSQVLRHASGLRCSKS